MSFSTTGKQVFFSCFTFLLFIFPLWARPLFAFPDTTIPEKRDTILVNRGVLEGQKPFESLLPIQQVPARIHIGESIMSDTELLITLNEINTIWWTQAGICFDFEVVHHDETLENGFNLWFGGNLEGWNGYFADTDEIRVVDSPDLEQAPLSSEHNAGRTAAHEFGHALHLSHRQDSDNNLMRSKTKGWLLNSEEIETARLTATLYSRPEPQLDSCIRPLTRLNFKKWIWPLDN